MGPFVVLLYAGSRLLVKGTRRIRRLAHHEYFSSFHGRNYDINEVIVCLGHQHFLNWEGLKPQLDWAENNPTISTLTLVTPLAINQNSVIPLMQLEAELVIKIVSYSKVKIQCLATLQYDHPE